MGGNVGVEVDATVWTAVPIGGGPGVEAEVGNKGSTKWEGSSDFVFGFRVSKGRVGEVVREEDYRKGAMFERENTRKKEPELYVLGVEQPDARDEGFDVEELMDDEDVVLCAIPREEESDDGW